LLVVLNFWSCIPEKNKKVESVKAFYDINGLIDEQIKLLDSVSPSILKKAIIDGEEAVTELKHLDSAGWSKELIVFKSADINRSILSDSYTISESSNTEIQILTYHSKYKEKTQVEELSIHLNKENHKPLTIHAVLDNSNELFKSAKTLELHFKEINDLPLITRYKISGWQKMISKDSTSYLIVSELIY